MGPTRPRSSRSPCPGEGREYQAVAIVDYRPDLIGLTADEAEEERRVLYVGTTRGRQSVLFTSAEDKLPQLLAELVRRPGRNEAREVQARRQTLLDDKRKLLVEQTRYTARIDQLQSGEALRQASENLIAKAAVVETAAAHRDQLSGQLDRPFFARLGQIATGRRRQLRRQLRDADDVHNAEVSQRTELDEEVALLSQHPEFLIDRAREDLDGIQQSILELDLKVWSAEARLNEIGLVGP